MTGLTFVLVLVPVISTALITAVVSLGSDEWVLVFKGVTGGSTSIYNLFMDNSTFNSFVKEAQFLNNTFTDHYKSDIINYWSDMNITKVKIGVYVGHEQKAFLEFNAHGCDRTTWFDRTNLINSSYTDMLDSTTPMNYFSMKGHVTTGTSAHVRRFYINSFYSGCDRDVGWFFVYDVGSLGVCNWEVDHLHETPAVLFSPHSRCSRFGEDRGSLRADFMTISVQFGSDSPLTHCSLPESSYCCRDCLHINEEATTAQRSDTTMSSREITTSPTVDMNALNNKIAEIKKELTVVKKTTSTYMRTKTSAHDGRQSCQDIGIFGVLILVTVLLLIVIPDMVGMFRAMYKKW